MSPFFWIFCFCNILLITTVYTGIHGEEEPFQCHILYEFNGTSGDIYSPFYEKGEYPPGLWCEYRITAPVGYQVKVTFVDIDISPHDFCSDDFLTVYANARESVLATVCGRQKPDPIITTPGVNMVHFLFRTRFLGFGRGFHIHYDAAPTLKHCKGGMSECHNTKCFDPVTQKCNGVDDCGDGTDEENCNFPLVESECGNPPITPDTIYREQDRIIAGQEVIPGSWPWQISMQNRYSLFSHSCGGSLINAQWVLTAGHCFKGNPYAENWRIHIGKHHKYYKDKTEQIRYVERIIIWPDKTGDKLTGMLDMQNDIALVKLSAPVKFTDAVRPACLPNLGVDVPAGTKCYVSGWGETRGTGFNDVLKQTDVSIMSRNDCGYQESSQICVKNREKKTSTCHGDSGGPLSCKEDGRWYVMGATSYGTLSNFQTGLCSMKNQMTVFMKVSDKTQWVKTMIDLYS